MRKIDTVIIHGADTPTGREFDVLDILAWHTDKPPKGNGWRDVGYHYVIRIDGVIETGRQEHVVGAHCRHHNGSSIGICLIGRGEYTDEQYLSLKKLVRSLKIRYNIKHIVGHYEYDNKKTCPCYDVPAWLIKEFGE